jgi:hypothetical protein
MDRRRTPSALLLLGAAWAGAVAGHTLTYLLTVPQAAARDALLASTGHNYWAAAVAVALVLGLTSALAVVARQFHGGLRGERSMGVDGVPRLAGRLAALQVSIFLLQEILERLDVGVPIGGVRTGRLLLVGVLIQTLVATALAIALFLLARVSAAAGRAFHRPAALSVGRSAAPAWRSPVLRSRLVVAGGGSRAPPR